jgi:CheY-like chemotaxis protein
MTQILFIEDSLEIRENMTEILELGGYQVLSAANGKEGLSIALEHLPQVVLCDIQMPLMNGFEVFKELKANPIGAHIPFIFVTASTEKKEIQAAMSMGADGYVCKPFDVDELFKVLKGALNGGVKG